MQSDFLREQKITDGAGSVAAASSTGTVRKSGIGGSATSGLSTTRGSNRRAAADVEISVSAPLSPNVVQVCFWAFYPIVDCFDLNMLPLSICVFIFS